MECDNHVSFLPSGIDDYDYAVDIYVYYSGGYGRTNCQIFDMKTHNILAQSMEQLLEFTLTPLQGVLQFYYKCGFSSTKWVSTITRLDGKTVDCLIMFGQGTDKFLIINDMPSVQQFAYNGTGGTVSPESGYPDYVHYMLLFNA